MKKMVLVVFGLVFVFLLFCSLPLNYGMGSKIPPFIKGGWGDCSMSPCLGLAPRFMTAPQAYAALPPTVDEAVLHEQAKEAPHEAVPRDATSHEAAPHVEPALHEEVSHGEAASHGESALHGEESASHDGEEVSHAESALHGEESAAHDGEEVSHEESASHEQGGVLSAGHSSEVVYQKITPDTAHHSSLPIWLILTPLLGALMLLLLRIIPPCPPFIKGGWWDCSIYRQGQGIIVTMISGLTLVISWLMYPLVIYGQKIGETLRQGIYYSIPFLPSFGLDLTFRVDPAALVLVVFTCLVWFLVSIFSQGYLVIENNRLRYNIANLCCLGVTLGAFLAGDLFTLYLFFESILLFLYLMVIHREDAEALRSAKVYLYFGVFTGLMLLFGIFLFSYFAGTIEIQSAACAFEHVHPGLKYLVAALFLVGFGGKAGVFLEHIWMPSSYGSAPCLTAALSSGIMIEVGAYGIFRTVNMIFAPLPLGFPASHLTSPSAWLTSSQLGYVLIFVGIMTMFLGAVNALFSTHALRLLAYSSVSQMGYIVMGIGCAAYMGKDGAMGLAGALYHIINHALFKVGLFLSIGVVYFHTRELDIRKLGGLWKDMPVAALTLLVSALAIAGFPLFNGFASKTMLHHAILEAYQHSGHLSFTHTPDVWLRIAEIIFIITAGGTFAYNMKLFTLVFLGPKKSEVRSQESGVGRKTADMGQSPQPPFSKGGRRGDFILTPDSSLTSNSLNTYSLSPSLLTPDLYMNVSLILFSASIVLLGLFPNWLLENFIGPMLPYFGFDSSSHAYHLIYNIHVTPSILPGLAAPVAGVMHSIHGGTGILPAGITHSHLPFWYDLVHGSLQISKEVIHNLSGGSTAIFVGGTIFLVFMGTGLCEKTLPEAWSLTRYYRKAFEGFRGLCRVSYEQIVGRAEKIISVLMVFIWIPGIKLDLVINKGNKGNKVDEGSELASSNDKGMFRIISQADQKYTEAVDQTVRAKRVFGHISKADQIYNSAFDKARDIAGKGIFDKIGHADEKLVDGFDKLAGPAIRDGIFNNAMRADGMVDGAYDRVIFSRFFWGMLSKHGEFKVGLWRYFNLLEDKYDKLIERAIFGLIGSEDLSKIQLGSKDFANSWFLRMCRRASEIHTGDISIYISWIVVTLTIIIATLIGFLYIKSFFALVVALTTMVTFFAVLVVVLSFFLKR